MLIAKPAMDLLTSEELEKFLGVYPPMPQNSLLLVPPVVISITKPNVYSLLLQASLEFSTCSLLSSMVLMPLRARAMVPVRS